MPQCAIGDFPERNAERSRPKHHGAAHRLKSQEQAAGVEEDAEEETRHGPSEHAGRAPKSAQPSCPVAANNSFMPSLQAPKKVHLPRDKSTIHPLEIGDGWLCAAHKRNEGANVALARHHFFNSPAWLPPPLLRASSVWRIIAGNLPWMDFQFDLSCSSRPGKLERYVRGPSGRTIAVAPTMKSPVKVMILVNVS